MGFCRAIRRSIGTSCNWTFRPWRPSSTVAVSLCDIIDTLSSLHPSLPLAQQHLYVLKCPSQSQADTSLGQCGQTSLRYLHTVEERGTLWQVNNSHVASPRAVTQHQHIHTYFTSLHLRTKSSKCITPEEHSSALHCICQASSTQTQIY